MLDATNAIAISSSGSIENFVEKMNQFASKLELQNTHFVELLANCSSDYKLSIAA